MSLRHSSTRFIQNCATVLMVSFMLSALLFAQNKKNNTSTNTPPPKPAPAPRPQPQVQRPSVPVNQQQNRGATNNPQRTATTTTGNTARTATTTTGNTVRTATTTTGNTARIATTTTGNTARTATTTTGNTARTATTATGNTARTATTTTGNTARTATTTTGNTARTATTTTGNTTRIADVRQSTQVQIHGKTATVITDGNHRVREIHHPDFDLHRGVRGERRIERRFPGSGRVVVVGRGHGFYERPYVHGYVQRTYFVGGRRYAVAYRTYYWGGRPYYRYAPAFYYHPVFYGWAYRPWVRPVYWSWGWGPSPWYGYYGYYFAPAPIYPSASFWLTDYVLAENLKLAYEAQSQQGIAPDAGAQASNNNVVLSPEVKAAIAQEVSAQLQAAEQAASSGNGASAQPTGNDNQAPPALDPVQRTFVVSSNLDVTDANGQECTLTAGDVIYRTGDPSGTAVNVLVQASKKGDCAANSTAAMQVADLQEMHNQFRQHIDAGLQMLAQNQGKGGLPAAPDTSTIRGEIAPPVPDNTADTQIQAAQNDADQAEKQASTTDGTN